MSELTETGLEKKSLAIQIRGLANAIDSTIEPERINQHLKDLESLGRLSRKLLAKGLIEIY